MKALLLRLKEVGYVVSNLRAAIKALLDVLAMNETEEAEHVRVQAEELLEVLRPLEYYAAALRRLN